MQKRRSASEVHPQILLRFLLKIKVTARDMAVAAGILVQILLVILFCGEEVFQRKQFNSKPGSGFLFLRPINRFDLRKLVFFRIIDSRPVLDASVIALFVYRERIDHHEIVIQQISQGNYIRVIVDRTVSACPSSRVIICFAIS